MSILPTQTLTLRAPTEEETAKAVVSSRILNTLLDKEESNYTLSNDTTQVQIPIPKEALSLLVEILAQMGKGNAVKIVPIRKELTTTEAADILNVSRPYLVELLNSGQIPFRSVGNRRRILLQDVLNYKNNIDAKREQILAELAAQAQELNMGY